MSGRGSGTGDLGLRRGEGAGGVGGESEALYPNYDSFLKCEDEQSPTLLRLLGPLNKMIFDREISLVSKIIDETLAREIVGGWLHLGKIPSFLIMQSIARYEQYSEIERKELCRAIALRCLSWFDEKFWNRWTASKEKELYNSFLLNRPWPDRLLEERKRVNGKWVKTCVDDALQDLLGAQATRMPEPGAFSYRGNLLNQEVVVEVLYRKGGTAFDIGAAPWPLADICLRNPRQIPSYDTLLGFGIGSWDQLESVNLDENDLLTLIAAEVKNSVGLVNRIFGVLDEAKAK